MVVAESLSLSAKCTKKKQKKDTLLEERKSTHQHMRSSAVAKGSERTGTQHSKKGHSSARYLYGWVFGLLWLWLFGDRVV